MTKASILAIDDDDMVLQYLSRTLSDRFTVITSTDPAAAVALAQTDKPDLVLCDIDMPGMDGGAVCAALADHPSTRDIPFVYLTAMVSPAEVSELGGYVGGKPGVSKRANRAQLVSCIEAQLQR